MYSNFLSEIDDKQIFSNQNDTPLPVRYLVEGYNTFNAEKGSKQKAILLPVTGSRIKQAILNMPADNKRALMEQYEKDVFHAKRLKYIQEKNAEQAAVKERLYPDYNKTVRNFNIAIGAIVVFLIGFFLLVTSGNNLNQYLNLFN